LRHEEHRRAGGDEPADALGELRPVDPHVERAGRVALAERRGVAQVHAPRAVYGRGLAELSGIRPLFLATIVSKDGGFGGTPSIRKSTKRALSRNCSAGLKRRSKPMVEPVLADIARPHIEPAPWPG